MAIIYKGIRARTGTNTRGVRTYSHEHLFHVEDRADAREYLVGSQPAVPQIGSAHPDDFDAYCESLNVNMVKAHSEWTVTANYTTFNQMDPNPLNDPAVIEWDGEQYEEVALFDNTGDAILNSAGDSFEDVMRERTRRVITVTKNVSNIPIWVIEQEDAINSLAFTLDGIIIPQRKAKMGAPRISREQRRNGYTFREMTMVIKLNFDGWKLKPLDAGFRYRDGSNNLKRCTSDDGTDATTPLPLDGLGGLLSDPTPSTAVFGDYSVYPEYDFNQFPLT